MNFLFDQSADFRLIPHLQELGHDVAAVSRNYPQGLDDEDILAIARDEERILLVEGSGHMRAKIYCKAKALFLPYVMARKR
jgi:predicted nuclease of predicted toxin-antitoxin system